MELPSRLVGRLKEDLELIPNEISTHSNHHIGINFYDDLSKLHLLAVKAGIKRAYFDSVKLPSIYQYVPLTSIDSTTLTDDTKFKIMMLKRAQTTAERLGLKFYVSNISRLDFVDTDSIPKEIVEQHARIVIPAKEFWIYSDEQVLDEIRKVEQGKMRHGDLLGYPSCCVDWLSQVKTLLLELCYEYYCKEQDPTKTEKLLKFLTENVEQVPRDEVAEVNRKISIHVAMTCQKFPFVVHHACGNCIDHQETPTSQLNTTYRSFAKLISPGLYSSIIKGARKYVYNYTKDWPSGPIQ